MTGHDPRPAGHIRRALRPEVAFLLLFVPISLLMMLAMPMFRVADEPAHLQRAYLISTGHILPTRETLFEPENLLSGTGMTHAAQRSLLSEPLSETLVPSTAGFNTGIYPPLSYVPQAVGMRIARLFTSSRLAMLFGARVGAWLVSTLLLFLSIRWLPWGKGALIAIALLPMLLSEVVSASADGLAIGAAAALVAWVLRLRDAPRPIRGRSWLVTLLLSVCVVSFKLLYAPLLLVLALLPPSCFATPKQRRLLCWAPPLLCAALMLGWLGLCYTGYVAGSTAEPGAGSVSTIVPQLQYVMHHPLRCLVTLLRTLVQQFSTIVLTLFGLHLGALDLTMPRSAIYASALALLAVWALEPGLSGWRCPAGRRVRIALLCAIALSVLACFLSLYLWWTPLHAGTIEGFQGRYLLPLMLPLFLALRPEGQVSPVLRRQALPVLLGLMGAIDLVIVSRVWMLTAL